MTRLKEITTELTSAACYTGQAWYLNPVRRVLALFFILLLLFTVCVEPKGNKMRGKTSGGNKKEGGRGRAPGSRADLAAYGAATTTTTRPSLEVYNEEDDDDLPHRNATNEERLLALLFHEYDPVARATMNVSRSVTVNIDFVLLRIHGLEERSQVLTSTGLVITEWTDDRLVWDPQDFGNLSDVIVKPEQIWLPEVALMNGADELLPDYFDRMRVLLRHDGGLHWEPGGVFRTTCDIDITYFPFDSQDCPLLIGAYSYHSNRVNVTNASSIMLTHDLQPNGEWLVSGSSVQWNVTVLGEFGDGYSHVIFTIHLERRYKFYLMNIVLPCLMLSSLIMVSFLLPPEAGEKISLGISVLLAFTVFLMMIADKIPRTSLAVPLIVIYLMSTMTLGTTSICLTVFVLNIHHRSSLPNQKLPPFFSHLLLVQLARLIRCQTTPLDLYLRQSKHTSNKAAEYLDKQRCQSDSNRPINLCHRTVQLSNKSGPPLTHTFSHQSFETPPTQPRKTFSSALRFFIGRLGKANVHASNGVIAPQANNTTSTQTYQIPTDNGVCRERLTVGVTLAGSRNQPNWSSLKEKPRQRILRKRWEEPESRASSDDWKELAKVLDRTFFFLVGIMMILSTIIVLLYPYYSRLTVSH